MNMSLRSIALASVGWLGFASGSITKQAAADEYMYRSVCPSTCSEVGPSPSNWTHLHDFRDLSECEKPILFDFNVYSAINSDSSITLRACVSSGHEEYQSMDSVVASDSLEELTVSRHCGAKTTELHVKPVSGALGQPQTSGADLDSASISSAADHLAAYSKHGAACGPTILFAKHKEVVVAMYSRAEVQKSSIPNLVKTFQELNDHSFQVCQSDKGATTFGLYSASLKDIEAVQEAIVTWNKGNCLDGAESTKTTKEMTLGVLTSTVKKDNREEQHNPVSYSLWEVQGH